ncbi:hypothetical protein [Methylobacterium flocculans]|uniref:hypothetical protein n=1 Tax=Methylobacterium flocculans TaxID=2984843 RepID=UPI0021F3BE52|nr:hypothetical protein [Methylobacterium sp. FF17]
MRRLPIVILTWTLFAAVMLAIGWVLKQVVPPFSAWLGNELGQGVSTLLVVGTIVVCGGFLLWLPRRSARRNNLPTRR